MTIAVSEVSKNPEDLPRLPSSPTQSDEESTHVVVVEMTPGAVSKKASTGDVFDGDDVELLDRIFESKNTSERRNRVDKDETRLPPGLPKFEE